MLVTNQNELYDVLAWLDRQDAVAVDTETTGLDPYGKNPARICGISLANQAEESYYLPFRHARQNPKSTNLGETVELAQTIGALSRYAASGRPMLFWNAKFDLHMLAADGMTFPTTGSVEDVMIAAHLLNENEPSYGLKEWTDRYEVGVGSLDERELRETIATKLGIRTTDKTWKGHIYQLDAEDVADYAESDTVLTFQAADAIYPRLDEAQLRELYADYNDYLLLIWRMEHRGIKLDVETIQRHKANIGPNRESAFRQILSRANYMQGHTNNPIPTPVKLGKKGLPIGMKKAETFNPLSSTQVMALTGWEKTDVRFIEELETDDPLKTFGELILDYRVLSKMQGTYYDAYEELIDRDHILRPNYNIHGTVSGRASCSRPNLQNVPRFTERRPVKDVFIPRDGYVLVEMDYQQAELRIATHYANEERMRDIFLHDRDPHGETASNMGVPRFVGKTLNFAVIYGAGVAAVMKTLKCDESTARAYLNAYHGLYPNYRKLSAYLQDQVARDGFLRLESGRIRRFDTFKYHAWEIKPHKAMNSLIQGTAAEMLRVGMLRLDARIRDEGLRAYLLLQVHDSLLIECHPDDVTRLIIAMRECLTDFGFDPAPAIDVKVGTTWAQMEKVA